MYTALHGECDIGEALNERQTKDLGSVYGKKGSVYAIPCKARQVAKFMTLGPDLGDDMKWWDGAMTDDGVIWSIATKIKIMLRPFIDGPFSGLPFLAFVSHIIWQCRALEELFDYS